MEDTLNTNQEESQNIEPATNNQSAEQTVDNENVETLPSQSTENSAKKSNKKQNGFVRFLKALAVPFVWIYKKLKGVFSEGKKVSWPKGKQTVKNTLLVFGTVIFFTVILFAFDFLFKWLITLLVK